MFEPGRACKETNICVTIAADDLYDPILSGLFSNFAGGGLRNVYRFGLEITSEISVVKFSIRSLT